jgi:hypothetical protein
MNFKKHKRKGALSELIKASEFILNGGDLEKVSISDPDKNLDQETFSQGYIARNPDNPRGERSKSIENRCLGKGEWNVYEVVCVDGTIKLSVNGKFVNGISQSSQRNGYICLESEGAEIHFRNIKIIELP